MRGRAVVFDVIGTLVHLTPLEEKLGGRAQLDAWFERLLHTSTSLTLAGEWQPFDKLAESTLKTALARIDAEVDADDVLSELEKLPPYPDAGPALDEDPRRLLEIGRRVPRLSSRQRPFVLDAVDPDAVEPGCLCAGDVPRVRRDQRQVLRVDSNALRRMSVHRRVRLVELDLLGADDLRDALVEPCALE